VSPERPIGSGRDRVRGLRFALFLFVLARPAFAQSGQVQVIVYDAAGRNPLAGVAVTLSNTDQRIPPTTVTTGGDGVADFPVLPSGGGYRLDVLREGFARQQFTDLHVRIGQVTRIPIQLTTAITEKVVLAGRRAPVVLEETSTTTRFDDAFFQDLPVKGRFYQNILSLAPGVEDVDGDGNPNVHGARFRDFKAEVGGVSNQDPLTGEWLSYIHPESIEEIEVVTAGAGVAYGRAQGGFANVIQKQGSNELEGVFSVLWNSSAFDGKAAVSTEGIEVPRYDWIQPSFQISGPIVRDRLWYRLSHEFISRERPINLVSEVAVTERRQSINSDQITWQVSPRNKLAFQFQYDPLTDENWGVSTRTAAESAQRLETGAPQYTLSWTAPVSPRLLFDSLVSYQDGHVNVVPATTGVQNDCVQNFVYAWDNSPALEFLRGFYCDNADTGTTSGSNYLTWKDSRQRLTVKNQTTWYAGRFLGVGHQVRAGFSVENERYFRFMDREADLTFVVTRGLGPETASVITRFALPPKSQAEATGTNWALWVEDQIRPASNLTLTLGVRFDQESIESNGWSPVNARAESDTFAAARAQLPPEMLPLVTQETFTAFEDLDRLPIMLYEALGIPPEYAGYFIDSITTQTSFWTRKRRPESVRIRNNNLAPRVSLAWDPWNDGKTKLALTAGRYFDKIFLAVPIIELEPPLTSLTFGGTKKPSETYWTFNSWPGGILPPDVQTVDRTLHTPYQDELTLVFEREILPETSIRLTLIARNFEDQLQDSDQNYYPADYGRCVKPSRPYYRTIDYTSPDGALDDCDGAFSGGFAPPIYWWQPPTPIRTSDGYLDTYIYNPAWGSILQVGNSNTARYRGAVIEFIRRLHNNLQFQASYTLSQVIGDGEDFNAIQGNDRTSIPSERGYLSYDQRHVFKFNLTAIAPGGFRFGGSARYGSGLPYSRVLDQMSYDSVPPQYLGFASQEARPRLRYVGDQRNNYRNPAFWTFDVKLDKEFKIGRRSMFQLSVEIFNLFNEKIYLIYNPDLGYGQEVNGRNEAFVTTGRQFQLGARVTF
jgi:outer membrane receptor protein involved in Fe transport